MSILIHTEANEASTDDVMDWLYHLAGPETDIVRINDTFPVSSFTCYMDKHSSSVQIETADGKHISGTDLSGNWYRRGQYAFLQKKIPDTRMGNIHAGFNEYYNRELQYVFQHLCHNLDKRFNGIGKYADNNINKLNVLETAARLGLDIPDTIVTSRFSELLRFAKQHDRIVIKPIAYPHFTVPVDSNTNLYAGFEVKMITAAGLEALKDCFVHNEVFYTLAQAYTDKKWEIRSFFLDGEFHSMAIFSQANEQTKTDFRYYDHERPNRCVPYSLPAIAEEQLRSLMQELQMNCGSFDIICTPDNRHVFLEVNPIGQYQWLTKNCNYFIDRKIALRLLKQQNLYGTTTT
ncbi:grasp-with-spasm system ATP-grasp peptide maturase [Chitinophagaceae bacterium MMS25-I14]